MWSPEIELRRVGIAQCRFIKEGTKQLRWVALAQCHSNVHWSAAKTSFFFHLQGDLSNFCSTSQLKRPLYFRKFTGLQWERQFFSPPMRPERLLLKVCSETTTKIAECHWSAAKTKSVFEPQRTCFFYIYKPPVKIELSYVSERFLIDIVILTAGLPSSGRQIATRLQRERLRSQSVTGLQSNDAFVDAILLKKMLKRRLFCLKTYLLLLIVSLANVPPVCSQSWIFRFRRFFLENKKLQKHYYSNTKCVTEPTTGFAGHAVAAARSIFFCLRSKNHWFYRHFWEWCRVPNINNNIYI